MMRTESNLARGIFLQLRVALLHGLTWKLFSLYYEIETIKSGLEVGYVITLLVFHVIISIACLSFKSTNNCSEPTT